MARPLPNNIKINPWDRNWSQTDLGEYISPSIAESIFNIWESISEWFQMNMLWIFLLIFFIGALHFFLKRLKKRQHNIQKLWHFLLFFLSKRQMMIPLLCTLGTRETVLSAQKKKRLLDLRNMSRDHSLQDHPEQRISLEEEISQLLFQFFNTLEEKGNLNAENPLFHIMKDLEYIDEKLVELQSIYNKEAHTWNHLWGSGPFKTIGLKTFTPFGE